MKVKTYAVNCNDAWLNSEGDDISDSYVKYKDYTDLLAERDADKEKIADLWQRVFNVQADFDASLHALLPDARYEQPDYGVSVSPLQQVERMIADYRQSIAELEARTVSVKLPPVWFDGEGPVMNADEVRAILMEAGIKLEVGE